ncbi:MAG: hypothetical protein PV344_01370, partial [Anaplasma sp.]|nr:hypothetical protein [Anaplasma sp.]
MKAAASSALFSEKCFSSLLYDLGTRSREGQRERERERERERKRTFIFGRRFFQRYKTARATLLLKKDSEDKARDTR